MLWPGWALMVFLSTPSARRATLEMLMSAHPVTRFLSTPSARRATRWSLPRWPSGYISIHALREEGDNWDAYVTGGTNAFLSTPSARRATCCAGSLSPSDFYFYPRPPRGGRRTMTIDGLSPDDISIHALREEGDPLEGRRCARQRDFYPRPPRGGRHVIASYFVLYSSHFYPRPPRGGRPLPVGQSGACRYFYPRPPRGGRRRVSAARNGRGEISIHALREEGDKWPPRRPGAHTQFLSTPSARRATR